jgi:hypothetical protein
MYAPLTTNRQGEENSQMGIDDNWTNMIWNYIYTTPMPLQNESKHNDNRIKGQQPLSKKNWNFNEALFDL